MGRSNIYSKKKITQIAQMCHEVNRAWCEINGDDSQVPWAKAPKWQKDSAIEGVKAALDGATPKQLHDSWVAYKKGAGWVYGEKKDEKAKTHPQLVPYQTLEPEQKTKDLLFHGTVQALIGVEITERTHRGGMARLR